MTASPFNPLECVPIYIGFDFMWSRWSVRNIHTHTRHFLDKTLARPYWKCSAVPIHSPSCDIVSILDCSTHAWQIVWAHISMARFDYRYQRSSLFSDKIPEWLYFFLAESKLYTMNNMLLFLETDSYHGLWFCCFERISL